MFRTDLKSLLSGIRLSASISMAHFATHCNRFCLYSTQNGRQFCGMGVKRFVPEVTSLFWTGRGEGLRSHLTWDIVGGVDGRGDPSTSARVRLAGATGLIIAVDRDNDCEKPHSTCNGTRLEQIPGRRWSRQSTPQLRLCTPPRPLLRRSNTVHTLADSTRIL